MDAAVMEGISHLSKSTTKIQSPTKLDTDEVVVACFVDLIIFRCHVFSFSSSIKGIAKCGRRV